MVIKVLKDRETLRTTLTQVREENIQICEENVALCAEVEGLCNTLEKQDNRHHHCHTMAHCHTIPHLIAGIGTLYIYKTNCHLVIWWFLYGY